MLRRNESNGTRSGTKIRHALIERADMTVTSIPALEHQIRDFINGARKQHPLLKDSRAWNQLCSSLDVVGDTELAFDAYEVAPETDDPGAVYILVYGVLQALVLQQDAVMHLAEALGLKYELAPPLREVRAIRNASIGHPTKRLGQPRSHFISRISMRKAGFQLMTVYPDHGPAEFKGVSLPALISMQRCQLRAVLEEVVDSLKHEEAEHKAMFKDDTLASAFPPTTDYYFEKIFESISSGGSPEYGRMHVQLLIEAVARFQSKLAERGVAGAYDSVEYHLDLVGYPLQELDRYFANPGVSRLNERHAVIFTQFAQGEIQTLRQMAAEIDESYQGEQDA